MVKLVPIIDIDDDDEETETVMVRSVSKLADSQVKGFDKRKDVDGRSSVVPTFGKAVHAETIIPKDGDTIFVDEVTVKVNGHASLNGFVSEQIIEDKEHSCTTEGNIGKRGFVVGDFVWCKIKNDPWWPAQVYDSKDASEMALRYREEGNKLLVALFGSGSASWCLPSQLLPFLENFVEMSRTCNSRIFLKAVEKAIAEFGRNVESDMICKCVPENQTSGLARPMTENGGLKAGVLVPEVKLNRLSVPEYEPYKVLSEVCHFAKTLSVGNKLHLAILKRRLSAFYRSKGGYQLPLYAEPVSIEGLGEKLSPVANCLIPFDTKRKKMKTLAELIGEKVTFEHKCEGGFSVRKKRKVEFLDSHNLKSRNLEEIEVIAGEDSSVEPKQKSDNVFTPRETKRTKYLSPHSKILIGSIGNSSSCKSVWKDVNDGSEENLPDEKRRTKRHCPYIDVGIPVNELLVMIQFAAITPLYLRNNGSFDKVSAFFSAVKNSTYKRGSYYKIYRKCMTGPKQKKKPLSSQCKLSPAVRTPFKMESGETGVFLSDVEYVKRDFEVLTAILEKYQTQFSVEEKGSLKKDIKQIKEQVENLSEKLISKFVSN